MIRSTIATYFQYFDPSVLCFLCVLRTFSYLTLNNIVTLKSGLEVTEGH